MNVSVFNMIQYCILRQLETRIMRATLSAVGALPAACPLRAETSQGEPEHVRAGLRARHRRCSYNGSGKSQRHTLSCHHRCPPTSSSFPEASRTGLFARQFSGSSDSSAGHAAKTGSPETWEAIQSISSQSSHRTPHQW